MVFIESNFTLSSSVHVISCCTYTYAAFIKDTRGCFLFSPRVQVMHVCACKESFGAVGEAHLKPTHPHPHSKTVRIVFL